jgi:uncharacterized membrane protein YqjE
MTVPQMQRSVPEVLHDIAGNLQMIVRSELRLAKTELAEKASSATAPAMTLGAGAVMAFYGFGFVLLACVYGLSIVLAPWLAALIIGGVLALTGGALALTSIKKLKSIRTIPDQTINSLEENAQWAKQQIK